MKKPKPLTANQLDAVVCAVETLCSFALVDTQGAIKKLVALDSRIRTSVAPHCREAIDFAMMIKEKGN